MTNYTAAIDVLARDAAARAVARHLDVTGWPVRQMAVTDKAAIRKRVRELHDAMAPTVGEVELAFDVLVHGGGRDG